MEAAAAFVISVKARHVSMAAVGQPWQVGSGSSCRAMLMTPWLVSTCAWFGVEKPSLAIGTKKGMGLSMSGAPPACP